MCSQEREQHDVNEYLDKVELVRLFRKGDLSLKDVLKRISEASPGDELLQVQPNGGSLLHLFSILGIPAVVEGLLKKGLKPTMVSCRGGVTLLQCSLKVMAGEGNKDAERARILKLYLSLDDCGNNLPIDNQDEAGWTALNFAAFLNLEKCVEVLLDHGAATRLVGGEGVSTLHNAIGNPSIVKMLLAADSGNVDAKTNEGDTALALALKRGDVESSMILLEHRANPNIPNNEGITPLFLAAKMGHLEMVQTLFKHGSCVNAGGGEQGITPLHWAAHTEKEAVALYLIGKGADVGAKDREGRSPLSMATPELAAKMKDAAQRYHPQCNLPCSPCAMTAEQKAVEACCSGNVNVLGTLVHAGLVDVNYASGDTRASLLHMAAYYGQLPVIMFLHRLRANFQVADSESDSVLHFACMKNFKHGCHVETVKILVSFLLPFPNWKNQAGDTPLMVALKNCFPSRAKILLWCKTDISIANNTGELPLHRASQDLRNIEVLFSLVERSANIDPQDHAGSTPLMHAAQANCCAAVKYLIQRGADPNIKDKQGCTPLFVGAQESNIGVCWLLLDAGADPNVQVTDRKITPLHLAVCKNTLPICKLLIDHGANPMVQDIDGHTPFSLASPVMKKSLTLLMKMHKEVESQLREGGGVDLVDQYAAHASLWASHVGTHRTVLGGPGGPLCPVATPNRDYPTPCNEASTCRAPDASSDESLTSDAIYQASCSATNVTPPSGSAEVRRSAVQVPEQGRSSTPESQPGCEAMKGQSSSLGDDVTCGVGSSNNDSDIKEGGKIERKDTFSKEQEEEEEAESGQHMSHDRYKDVQAELTDLTKLVAEQREELERLKQANSLLASKNQSLADHMKKSKNRLVTTHMDHALSLSMHVLSNGLINSQKLRNNETPSHELRVDGVPCSLSSAAAISKEPGKNQEPLAQERVPGSPEEVIDKEPQRKSSEGRDNVPCSLAGTSNGNPKGDWNRASCSSAEGVDRGRECSWMKPGNSSNSGSGPGGRSQAASRNPCSTAAVNGEVERKVPGRVRAEGTDRRTQEVRPGDAPCPFSAGRRGAEAATQTGDKGRSRVSNEVHPLANLGMQSMQPSPSPSPKDAMGKQTWELIGGGDDEEGGAAGGLGAVTNYNPLGNGYLQWWMVDRSAVEMDQVRLNESVAPKEKFFDVHRGTFHQMDVVVRVVRNVAKWSYEQYMTFFREVNYLSCLHCPYVVQFLAACFEPASKTCMVINEYMSRGSLHSILHETRLPLEWGTRVSMMLDIARGLSFLHSHDVIHRYLTPTNILIGEHFNAKLSDYGLYETKLKSGFFENCKTKCPPVYIAPEALRSFEFSQPSDIYSFGIVMYECGVGKKVFADITTNPMTLVLQLMMGSRPAFPVGVAPAYKALAEKCWAGDPDFRPTAEQAADELCKIPRTA